jgi:hypothetical protein
MFRISKSTLSWGGVAVAAILITLAVPRAAHAVAAALVQVTNTASSPVISQGIGNQAAQIVEIECGYNLGAGNINPFGCAAVPPNGFTSFLPPGSKYTVPEGETLVVTAVDIFSGAAAGTPCMSYAFPQVILEEPIGPSTIEDVPRKSWIVPSGAGTAHYVYPSGILFPAGGVVYFVSNSVSACTVTIDMHGYLTAQ